MSNSENNKRIAKNTLFLYFRMLLMMLVTLYTSRVVLKFLGVEDFGIYNVVGGVITIFTFLSGALGGAAVRFITYAVGSGELKEIRKVFSVLLSLHIILAGLVFVLGETIGLWFVINKLIIPVNRLDAALWVYHCSILTMIVSIISIPYNSLIIARERMNAFAYISIIEVFLKLAIVFLLPIILLDKLVVYAVLMLLVQLLIRFSYSIYCEKHFVESVVRPSWDKMLIKSVFSYISWSLTGGVAAVGYTQGINILLNIFFGPTVNAARAVSVQVQSAVTGLVNNFQMAVKPQIIKSYAVDDLDTMHKLVVASSKYGFALMLLITLPLIICINTILFFWLGIVPEDTDAFVLIMLVIGLIEPHRVAILNAVHATGEIKTFQICESLCLLLVLPLSYLGLKFLNLTAVHVMLIILFIQLLTQLVRLKIILPQISMNTTYYVKNVCCPIFRILPIVVIILMIYFHSERLSFGMMLRDMCLTEFLLILSLYFIYLDVTERVWIKHNIGKILSKLRSKK